MALILKQFEIGPMQNLGYLIGDDKTREAFLVDPAWQVDTLKRLLAESDLKLAGLIITHAHYDHTNGIQELLQTADVPVYAQKEEIEYAKMGTSLVNELGKTAKGLSGGDKIKVGETEITFLHTPGHTPGSQCIQVENKLITGDTLFIGGCGRSDLPGGDPAVLYHTLKKFSEYPEEWEILPGHDYGPTLSRPLTEERKENPYLQLNRQEDFVRAVT